MKADVVPDTRKIIDLNEIPTPALVIEKPIVERNVERMAAYAEEHKLGLRPHTKTHKSLSLARLQMQAGASGLTTAKVGEAEVMAEATRELLIAYPTVDPARARRIAELARQINVLVALDSSRACDVVGGAVSSAGSTVGVLVDIDVGFHRTGVQDARSALAIAKHVQRKEGLRLDGVLCFPGHLNAPPDQQGPKLAGIDRQLKEVIDLWHLNDLEARIVSGGSTPTARQSHLVSSLTEIRPGTYIFNDWNSVAGGHCEIEDCAASVVCTVVSDAVPDKVVVDAGSKALTSDRNAHLGPDGGFGHVKEYPDAKIVRLSEEHGEIDFSSYDYRPALGERISIIPNHICPVVNLQNHFWLGSDNSSYEMENVDTRGLLS